MFGIGRLLSRVACRQLSARSPAVVGKSQSFSRVISRYPCRFLSTAESANDDSVENKFKSINLEELAADSVSSRLRRALLYVPGNDQRKIDKVKSIMDTVDTVVFDCEDGVAVNKKVCFDYNLQCVSDDLVVFYI